MSCHPPILQSSKAECRPGDWILPEAEPEWSDTVARHYYLPPASLLKKGPVLMWIFQRDVRIVGNEERVVWVRV